MFAALGINLDIVVFAMMAIIVILLVALGLTINHHIKLRRIMKNCSLGRLDETIISYYNKLDSLADEIRAQAKKFSKYENNAALCIQKVGCIRYNAFDDTGSDLSYSIALLDQYDTGFVLTGIFARDSSNTYLKPIINGESRIMLTQEEKRAIAEAIERYNEKHIN